MRSWLFAPNRVNFSSTGASPTVTAVPNAPGRNTLTAAAYDEANNLLFYVDVNSSTVYTASGGSVGVLNNYNSTTVTNSDSPTGYEIYSGRGYNSMAVVPVPGSCKRFYLITTLHSLSNHALVYATIDCSSGTPIIAQQTSRIDELGGNSFGIAVSKLRNGNERDLYHGSGGSSGMVRYIISASGIGSGTTQNISASFPTDEMDLSPNGNYLTWARFGTLYWATRSSNGDITNVKSYIPKFGSSIDATNLEGVEFSPDSKTIFVAASRISNNENHSGIIAVSNIDSTPQSTYIAGSSACYQTQLELAHDGLIYGVGNGTLYTINPNSLTFNTSPVASTINLNTRGFEISRLPNQIDGEDYQYFFGVAAATLAIPRVDGLSIFPNTVQNVYNCNPLALSAASTNASSFRVTVTSALADGTLTNAYSATTGFTSPLPNSLQALLNGRTGYYQVLVEARNSCGQTVQRSGLIQVSSLTPSSVVLKFNDCSGSPQTPSNNPNDPSVVGQYGASISISNSTGDYDTYQASFEQWTGLGYQLLGSPTAPIAKTSGNLAAIPLSGLANQAGLGSGYFAPGGAGSDKVVRLAITLTNACGSSTAAGIFTPTDVRCRGTYTGQLGTQLDTRVSFFPNPLANEPGRLEYTIPIAQPVTLTLVDALTGKVVLTLLDGATQTAGTHALGFDSSRLPKGLYFYRLVTDHVLVGRLSKSE